MSKFKKVLKLAGKVAPVAGLALGGAGLAGFGPLAGSLGGIGGSLGKIGSIAGKFGNVFSALNAGSTLLAKDQKQKGPPAAAPFNPQRPGAMARPSSLGGMDGFDSQQERSALATKGVNSGLGDEENAYYRNLVSRSLIGDDNKVVGSSNSLLPVESQYFSRQGYNTSDIMELLKALQGA